MFVNHVTLSGRSRSPFTIRHAKFCMPCMSAHRCATVFVLGQRLFEDGGSVALEAMIDAVEHRLGRDRAGRVGEDLEVLVEGENLAA